MNILGEKIAAIKLEEETFTFSLDGLSNHDFAALRFIFHSMGAVQISIKASFTRTRLPIETVS